MDNGIDYPDGEWAEGWDERCGNNILGEIPNILYKHSNDIDIEISDDNKQNSIIHEEKQ